ncbi:MAG: hypothetical protein V8S24_01985 [Gordonibacter pamelaeae]
MGNTDRLIRYIASCNHSGIPVLPPDINSSNVEFTPTDEGVRFGWWACAAWARTWPRPSSRSARPTARTRACTTS